jgi:hypothetical protein
MKLRHHSSGHEMEAPIGFSFTTLFFGIFVPLLRGDVSGSIIMLIATFLTGGLAWLVFPFIYNEMYIKALQKQGYVVVVN